VVGFGPRSKKDLKQCGRFSAMPQNPDSKMELLHICLSSFSGTIRHRQLAREMFELL